MKGFLYPLPTPYLFYMRVVTFPQGLHQNSVEKYSAIIGFFSIITFYLKRVTEKDFLTIFKYNPIFRPKK